MSTPHHLQHMMQFLILNSESEHECQIFQKKHEIREIIIIVGSTRSCSQCWPTIWRDSSRDRACPPKSKSNSNYHYTNIGLQSESHMSCMSHVLHDDITHVTGFGVFGMILHQEQKTLFLFHQTTSLQWGSSSSPNPKQPESWCYETSLHKPKWNHEPELCSEFWSQDESGHSHSSKHWSRLFCSCSLKCLVYKAVAP